MRVNSFAVVEVVVPTLESVPGFQNLHNPDLTIPHTRLRPSLEVRMLAVEAQVSTLMKQVASLEVEVKRKRLPLPSIRIPARPHMPRTDALPSSPAPAGPTSPTTPTPPGSTSVDPPPVAPSRTSVIVPSVDSPQRPAFSVVSPIKQLGPMRVPFHSALVGTPVRAPGQENQSFPAPATMGTSPSFSGSPIDIDQFFNDIIAEEVLCVPSSTNDVFGLFGPANHLLSPNAPRVDDRSRTVGTHHSPVSAPSPALNAGTTLPGAAPMLEQASDPSVPSLVDYTTDQSSDMDQCK